MYYCHVAIVLNISSFLLKMNHFHDQKEYLLLVFVVILDGRRGSLIKF